uniref:Uncharacterized protein n=1 Tax=Anguilla anguilla TaxID=7936 RepID=A0A0E9ULB8_ANGAN
MEDVTTDRRDIVY